MKTGKVENNQNKHVYLCLYPILYFEQQFRYTLILSFYNIFS